MLRKVPRRSKAAATKQVSAAVLGTARWRKSTGMKREPSQRTMTEVRPWQEISLSLRSLVFRSLPAQPTYVSKKSLQHHCLNLLPSVPASERARDQALFHCSSSPASQSRYQPSHLMFPSELQRVLPQSNERKPSDQMKLAFLDWGVWASLLYIVSSGTDTATQ